jgi:upstream activation factor subunit UAF30
MATAKKAPEKKAAPAKKAAAPAKKSAAVKAAAIEEVVEAPVKKAPAKKAAKAEAAAPAKKATSAFMKPMTPSAALAAIVGAKPLPRTEVTKKIWVYIKKHDLQDASNRRMINADDKLKVIFKKDQASMFEMTKMVSEHLK